MPISFADEPVEMMTVFGLDFLVAVVHLERRLLQIDLVNEVADNFGSKPLRLLCACLPSAAGP